MGIFDKFKGKPEQEVVEQASTQSFVVPVEQEYVNKMALLAAGRQKGEWVMSEFGLGIVTGCDKSGAISVTLIKSDGNTKMRLGENDQAEPDVVMPNEIRRAYLDEVPASRHPDVDHESHMRSFGFIHSSEA